LTGGRIWKRAVAQLLLEPGQVGQLLGHPQPIFGSARRIAEYVLKVLERTRKSELAPDAMRLCFSEPARLFDLQASLRARDRSQLPIDLAIACLSAPAGLLTPRRLDCNRLISQHRRAFPRFSHARSASITQFFGAIVCAVRAANEFCRRKPITTENVAHI